MIQGFQQDERMEGFCAPVLVYELLYHRERFRYERIAVFGPATSPPLTLFM